MSITPEELKEYSVFESVTERKDRLLEMDIIEAETYIESEFTLTKPLNKYIPLPKKLKLALLKVAQFYALVNSDESMVKGYKSEKMGDYSYTLKDGSSFTFPDIQALMNEFIEGEPPGDNDVFLRIRSL